MRCIFIGSSSADPMLCLGSREAYGSWKTTCIFLRKGLRRLPFSADITVPSKVTLPLEGSVSLISVLPRVVLPQPDSPTSPKVSPLLMPIETPSTAFTYATVRLRIPLLDGNHLKRFSVLRR